jgi:hypothetical protein
LLSSRGWQGTTARTGAAGLMSSQGRARLDVFAPRITAALGHKSRVATE